MESIGICIGYFKECYQFFFSSGKPPDFLEDFGKIKVEFGLISLSVILLGFFYHMLTTFESIKYNTIIPMLFTGFVLFFSTVVMVVFNIIIYKACGEEPPSVYGFYFSSISSFSIYFGTLLAYVLYNLYLLTCFIGRVYRKYRFDTNTVEPVRLNWIERLKNRLLGRKPPPPPKKVFSLWDFVLFLLSFCSTTEEPTAPISSGNPDKKKPASHKNKKEK